MVTNGAGWCAAGRSLSARPPGSHGILFVSGAFRSVNPRIVAVGSGALADALVKGDGVVCLGRVALCGATSGTVPRRYVPVRGWGNPGHDRCRRPGRPHLSATA